MGTPPPAANRRASLPAALRDLHPHEAPRRRAVGRASLTNRSALRTLRVNAEAGGSPKPGDDRATHANLHPHDRDCRCPNRDRSRLEFGDGLYGPRRFPRRQRRTASPSTRACPARHGPRATRSSSRTCKPPTSAAARRPRKRPDLRRRPAVMAGDILLAVVVSLCGDDAERRRLHRALAQRRQAVDAEMGLVDGYCGAADAFGWLSPRHQVGPAAPACPASPGRRGCGGAARPRPRPTPSCAGKTAPRSA